MLKTGTLTDLQQGLDWLKTKSERKYGHAVWDARCRPASPKSDVVIAGYVLLREQRNALHRLAMRLLGKNVGLGCEIEVLAGMTSGRKAATGRPKTELLNIYSRPLDCSSLKADREKFLSTQATPYDPSFRILSEHKGWFLVQLIDGTLGWAESQLIDATSEPAPQADAMRDGLSFHNSCARPSSEAIVETARTYFGTPYVLGGATRFGIDCSGLVQMVYKNALGVILPKHSRDQILIGRPLLLKSYRPGDLVFFKGRRGDDLHVGVMCQGQKVIHASRQKGAVTIDELATLTSRLDIIQLRRIESFQALSKVRVKQMV